MYLKRYKSNRTFIKYVILIFEFIIYIYNCNCLRILTVNPFSGNGIHIIY